MLFLWHSAELERSEEVYSDAKASSWCLLTIKDTGRIEGPGSSVRVSSNSDKREFRDVQPGQSKPFQPNHVGL